MHNTIQQDTNAWANAVDYCMAHMKYVGSLADVIKALKEVSVASVVPIVSSTSATLLVTPVNSDEKSAVQILLSRVATLTGIASWKLFKSGDYWMIRGREPHGVVIDVLTTIPHSKPDSFEL